MTTNRSQTQQQNSSILKNSQIPLLKIPEANIQIFSDCIVRQDQKFPQPKTSDTGQSINLSDPKFDYHPHHSWPNKLQKQIVIKFNNPDYAFNIDQNNKRVQIHDLLNHTIPLKFQVKSMQIMLTVQSLLRRKMCELGFQTKYRLIRELGKGATAVVHLIQRISDNKKFAAKIISIKDSNDKSYQTFINQSKLLRILKHKNIINLQSLYIHKKQLIQVMQYLNGGTLLQLIRNNQLKTKKQKWKVLRDITMGLDFLRQRRIIHRDIKMENILIRNYSQNNQRDFVISDFGLATWVGEKNLLFQRCGTPGYIAPEVLNAPKGKPMLSHKVDIFSLGAIAHVIFLHQPLFTYTGNIKQLLKLNKRAQYSFTNFIYEDLSISEMSFLEMTLEKDPEKRATSKDLIEEIRYISSQNAEFSVQKSARKSQKQLIKVDETKYGVEVQIKKATSLTKNRINLSEQKQKKQRNECSDKKSGNSARKFLSDVWASLTSPSPKKQGIKIKQNSMQKQKKLKQYFQ